MSAAPDTFDDRRDTLLSDLVILVGACFSGNVTLAFACSQVSDRIQSTLATLTNTQRGFIRIPDWLMNDVRFEAKIDKRLLGQY